MPPDFFTTKRKAFSRESRRAGGIDTFGVNDEWPGHFSTAVVISSSRNTAGGMLWIVYITHMLQAMRVCITFHGATGPVLRANHPIIITGRPRYHY